MEAKLKRLAADKTPGPDGIHHLLLKESASAVAEPLPLIFVKSFENGKLPDDWRTAYVVPIFKKGSRTDRANYQPVLLTPIKIMDSLINEQMLAHLDTNSFVTDAQHGFMYSRSCLTNLLELESLENWTKSLDEGYGIDLTLYIWFLRPMPARSAQH